MQEEAQIEKEASAPLLVQIIRENGIKSLGIDLDNTVLKTNEYYWLEQDSCSVDLAEHFMSSIPTETFVKRMDHNLRVVFFEEGLMLIQEKYQRALKRYFKDNYPLNFDEYFNIVNESFKDFYTQVPEMIEGSDKVIQLAQTLNVKYVFNSNAHDAWTRLKVKFFEEILNIENIPYTAVPEDVPKDEKSWSDSADKVETPIENMLIIGDGLETDILAGIRAGCRNLVWIRGDVEKLPLWVVDNSDIRIWCVDSIKDLL
jgi:predicted HAD superfamily phosphohydrolase YqeG